MMAANIPLDEADIAWLNSYGAEVRETFGAEFSAAADRFARWKPLLQRFTDAVEHVLKNGRSHFSGADEAHNEVCIAGAILLTPASCAWITSRLCPAVPIDFRAAAEDGTLFYVDVKTIKPAARDRWEQYEKARQEQWFPERVHVSLSKDWLGGEMWHSMFAARGKMLEYALEFEAKIADAKLSAEKTLFVTAFCGDGVIYFVCHAQKDVVFLQYSE